MYKKIIEIRKLAEDNAKRVEMEIADSSLPLLADMDLYLEHRGRRIYNPWAMPSGNTPISTKKAVAIYGPEKMNEFCKKAFLQASPVSAAYAEAHKEEEGFYFEDSDKARIGWRKPVEDRGKLFFLSEEETEAE